MKMNHFLISSVTKMILTYSAEHQIFINVQVAEESTLENKIYNIILILYNLSEFSTHQIYWGIAILHYKYNIDNCSAKLGNKSTMKFKQDLGRKLM